MASSVNAAEMARRQFRDIARVAGLLFPGYPGQAAARATCKRRAACSTTSSPATTRRTCCCARRTGRCWNGSSRRAASERALARLDRSAVLLLDLERVSPLGFPLLVDRLREKLSSEKLADRIRRLQATLEREPPARKGRAKAG